MQFHKSFAFLALLGAAICLPGVAGAQQTPVAPAPTTGKTATTTTVVPSPAAPPSNAASKSKLDDNPSIKVSVNEVILPVTVTDDRGRFVSDLTKSDFQVFEENKPQTIRFFTRDRNQPVVMGFLLDSSAASRIHWKNFQNATEELIQNLMPGDAKYSGYLITYGGQDAEVAVNTTNDPELLVDKIRKLHPGGGSALFDAIELACTNRKLVRGEPFAPRRVVIIVGDGHDNASKHSLDQVVELAQRNLVTVYCISTEAFGFANASNNTLVRLATQTGGRVVYPLGEVYKDTDGYLSHPSDDGNYALTVGTGAYKSVVDSKMYRAVSDIVGEVTTQYILRYVSDNDDAKSFRNVKVVVDLANVRVRARRGYYAVPPPSSPSGTK